MQQPLSQTGAKPGRSVRQTRRKILDAAARQFAEK
jgi:AcrR family transcriptional regulator